MIWTGGKGVYYFDGDVDMLVLRLMLVVWSLWWL